MILDLKRIFVNENSSLPIEYALDMSGVEFSGTYPLKKPVKISGTVTNKASLTVLDAEITYEYSAPWRSAARGCISPAAKPRSSRRC